jgi:hypothetical protein
LSKCYTEQDISVLNNLLDTVKVSQIFSSVIDGIIPFWSVLVFYKGMLDEARHTVPVEEIILTFAKGIIVDEILEDIGSGLNYNRKKWNKLIGNCMLGLVKTILIAHKDRFICIGYDWFERFLKSNGVEIIVVNNEKLSPLFMFFRVKSTDLESIKSK